MTNKPWDLNYSERISFYKVTLIKQPNMKISHEGKTNTLTESRIVFVY